MALYAAKNQWGGSTAPWHEGGVWVLGCRDNQNLAAANIKSADGGETFSGTITYAGEGPISFRAKRTTGNGYAAEVQWGGSSAPWHNEGNYVIGARDGQRLVALNVSGQNLAGTCTYAGEGPIGFKSVMSSGKGLVFATQNQWGGSSAPWHQGGVWVLGGRNNQALNSIQISSSNTGQTFSGTITYAGEGPIGFRATKLMQNCYAVENQWGGSGAPWHPGGNWIIGGRTGQAVVAMSVQNMVGTITYNNEGPIGFKVV
jgi:hypothetical protein